VKPALFSLGKRLLLVHLIAGRQTPTISGRHFSIECDGSLPRRKTCDRQQVRQGIDTSS
jgi:hypothetical protein